MLILQFFGGFVVSLLASIGVLQTPGVSWGGIPGTLAVYRVTINRRPSDALVVMGAWRFWRFHCLVKLMYFRCT